MGQPGQKNLTPKKMGQASQKNLTPKMKWKRAIKWRDSTTGLFLIQSSAAVCPRLMEKSGKLRKGLHKILSHLHPNELLRTFPEAGVNSSSSAELNTKSNNNIGKVYFWQGRQIMGWHLGVGGKGRKCWKCTPGSSQQQPNHEQIFEREKTFSFHTWVFNVSSTQIRSCQPKAVCRS